MFRRNANVIARVFDGIKQATKFKNRESLVGVDHYGNKYFEGQPDKKGKKRRRVEGKDPEDIMTNPTVPVEWLTWLQHRKEHPPTEEDMMRHHMYTVRTLQRAHDLEKTRENEDKSRDKEVAQETTKKDELASKFPVYPEYKTDAWHKYKPQDDGS